VDDPLPAGFPLAVNFLVAAAFFGPVAGGDRLGLSFADGGAVTNFPAHLRCNISGQIFGRTPPDAIVTCFRSYINQIFRNNNTSYTPVPVALMAASQYELPDNSNRHRLGSTGRIFYVKIVSSLCFEINFSDRQEISTV